MKKITIFSDVHKFGIHELDIEFEYGDDIFHLGDNFDLKGCKKQDVNSAKHEFEMYKQKAGKNYVSGNHELGFERLTLIKDHIMFTHGDYVFWDDDKFNKFRSNTPGKKEWKRWVSFLGDKIRKFQGPKKWKKKNLKKAARFAKANNCHTFICGHVHPRKTLDKTYNGVRCICVPRGRTEVLVK